MIKVLETGNIGNVFGWLKRIIWIYIICYWKMRFTIRNVTLRTRPWNGLDLYAEVPLS